jgi:ferrous iron transport protein B
VTVEKRTGVYADQGVKIHVIDLPGIYSLTAVNTEGAMDERIACDYIQTGEADLIVNVLDASNLERNLYLTTQLLEMRVPIVIALNMLDIAKGRGLHIDCVSLSKALGCPVVPMECNKQKGVTELRAAIYQSIETPCTPTCPVIYPEPLQNAIQQITEILVTGAIIEPRQAHWLALQYLEGAETHGAFSQSAIQQAAAQAKQHAESVLHEECDILIADSRYSLAHRMVAQAVQAQGNKRTGITYYLDKCVLNRWLGIPIFLGMMYLMFLFAINIGGAFQDFFNIGSDTIFIKGVSHVLRKWVRRRGWWRSWRPVWARGSIPP